MSLLHLITARIEQFGGWSLASVSGMGAFGILFGQAMGLALRPPYRIGLLFKQMEFIGNKSLGVVMLTGLFTGMVLTFQTYRSLRDFSSESIVGGLVAVAMTRELGPVLSALMVNARAGSAIAAEIGTMRVTEQVDALFALAVNPVQYLVTPRVIAGFVMVPMLTAVSDMTGIMGGYLVGVLLLGVDPGIFMAKIIDFVTLSDILQGTVKAATFGTVLTQVAAYKGYVTSGGAEGVGRATTEAVVASSVLVTGWQPGRGDTYTLYAHFDNASGLLVGSPVQTAGVKVGEVSAISLVQGQARVRMDIFRQYALYADATATIKSIGILGDKYVDVQPGTATQAPLQDGETIILVQPGADLDTLVDNMSQILQDVKSVTGALRETLGGDRGRERLDTILEQIERATRDISRITDATNRQIDTILGNLDRFAANLNAITEENRTGIRDTVDNLSSLSRNLDQLTAENRAALKRTLENFQAFSDDLRQLTAQNRETLQTIVANLDRFTATLAEDTPEITGDLKEILADNKQSLNNAVTNLDRSFDKLDETMSSVQSISDKLDRGEGSLGKLINDETTVNELNSALSGLNKFLTEADRIKLDVGGHFEYLVSQGDVKSYLDLRIQPLKDRYYLVQLVDNPRGDVEEKTVITEQGGVTTTTRQTTVDDEFQLSLIIAQRYFDTVLKAGLFENTFGVGVEQFFGNEDQYRIGLDVWDFDNDLGAHVKLTGYWRFFSNAFLVVGGDDLVSDNDEFRDAFFGIGIRFNEDSLKPLFSSVPVGSATN